jgi:hypothetical protein
MLIKPGYQSIVPTGMQISLQGQPETLIRYPSAGQRAALPARGTRGVFPVLFHATDLLYSAARIRGTVHATPKAQVRRHCSADPGDVGRLSPDQDRHPTASKMSNPLTGFDRAGVKTPCRNDNEHYRFVARRRNESFESGPRCV